MAGSFGLALLAGLLSTLSPCVLPLLPIVIGTALSQHRFGPLALAAGLSMSFVAIGLFVATIGFSIGLDGGIFRALAAMVLLGFGLILVLPSLQPWLTRAGSPLGRWAEQRLGSLTSTGLTGQFSVGLLLGALWSPCVGPTLGAASMLAAEGRDLGQVASTMFLFGLGAALPLLLMGTLSRRTSIAWKANLLRTGQGLKIALGATLILTSITVLSGLDRIIEAVLVAASPSWLTDVTSRF